MQDWTPWNGGVRPVAVNAIVEVQYRGPADPAKGIRIEWPCPAGRLDWSYEGSPDDIVSYRVNGWDLTHD